MKEILIKFLKKFKKQNKVAAHHLKMLENMPDEYFEEMDSQEVSDVNTNKRYAEKYVKSLFSDVEFAKAVLGKKWKKLQAGLTNAMWRKNLKKLEN